MHAFVPALPLGTIAVARVVVGAGAAVMDVEFDSAVLQLSIWLSGSRLHASIAAFPLETIAGGVVVAFPSPEIDPVDEFHVKDPYFLLSKDFPPPALSCQPFNEKL